MALLIGDHLTPSTEQVPYWDGSKWALRVADRTKIAVLTPSGAIIPTVNGAVVVAAKKK